MKYVCMLLSAAVNLASGKTAMSDDLKGAIITALVTGIISIFGFIVTNISMLWFQLRLTDYETNKNKFKNANNRLIDELNLRTEFKIL